MASPFVYSKDKLIFFLILWSKSRFKDTFRRAMWLHKSQKAYKCKLCLIKIISDPSYGHTSVKEVVTPLYSKFIYKMDNYFLGIQ